MIEIERFRFFLSFPFTCAGLLHAEPLPCVGVTIIVAHVERAKVQAVRSVLYFVESIFRSISTSAVVLHGTVPYCPALYYTVLIYAVLHGTVLCCTVQALS